MNREYAPRGKEKGAEEAPSLPTLPIVHSPVLTNEHGTGGQGRLDNFKPLGRINFFGKGCPSVFRPESA